jgi:glucosamine-6-phosphate deaminase
MNIHIYNDYDEMSKAAADYVYNFIKSKPNAVLGLPTGSTPIGMYKELIKLYKENKISFKDITTFNLDEYENLDESNVNSYHYFMFDNFFNHIDIDKENINILSGTNEDYEKECKAYEDKIEKAGGIDLMILGLGINGHVGFNEPSDYFSGETYRIKLHEDTIEANSRFFDNVDEVPRYALTMGIKSIMNCKEILLLAGGGNKANAIKGAVEGPITPQLPASVLQLHSSAVFMLDNESAKLLSK